MLELLKKLEEFYKFECEAGELKNCIEWIKLKESIKELLSIIYDTKISNEK